MAEENKKQNPYDVIVEDKSKKISSQSKAKSRFFTSLTIVSLLVIFVTVAFFVVKSVTTRKQSKVVEKAPAETMAPPSRLDEDIALQKQKKYTIKDGYVIVNINGRDIAVTSDGRAYYVSTDGIIMSAASDFERNQAYNLVLQYSHTDQAIKDAFYGVDIAALAHSPQKTNEQILQDILKQQGYSSVKDFEDSLSITLDNITPGVTLQDLQEMADAAGIPLTQVYQQIATALANGDEQGVINAISNLKENAVRNGYQGHVVDINFERPDIKSFLDLDTANTGSSGTGTSEQASPSTSISAGVQTMPDTTTAPPEQPNPIKEYLEKNGLRSDNPEYAWLYNNPSSTGGYATTTGQSGTGTSTNSMTAAVQALAAAGSGYNNGVETGKQQAADKTAWVNEQQSAYNSEKVGDTELIKPQETKIVAPKKITKWDLVAGTVVPITLVTGINTDNPGDIVGLVRQDVYDTLTGSNILIPKGSRVMAKYNNSVTFGQNTVQITWNQLITPDGYTYTLPGFQGVEGNGMTGVEGDYDGHFWGILGATVLGTLMDYTGKAVVAAISNTSAAGTAGAVLGGVISGAVTQTQQVGQKYIDKAISQNPTIRIQSGHQTQLLVNKTINLYR